MTHDEAVIYVRASKDRTGAGVSIGTQETECRAEAAGLGKKVRRVYADNDISAAQSRKPRKEYQRMLRDLEADPADVIVWHPDRLHRRLAELERYIEVIEPRDILTFTVQTAPIDLATPSGRAMARILGVMASHEVEHMSERHKAAKRRNAAAGKPIGRPRAFGYSADGMALCHSEIVMTGEEAERRGLEPLGEVVTIRGPRVRVALPYDEAAELQAGISAVLAGSSLYSVARDWNTRGVLTSKGEQWCTTSVKRVLGKARNAGLLEHDGIVVGDAKWPGVIDEVTWHRLRAVLGRKGSQAPSASRALGTGVYECGVCGFPMRFNGGSQYRCSRSRKPDADQRRHPSRDARALDAYVELHIVAWLNVRGNIRRLRKPPADLAPVEKELAAIGAELEQHAAEAGARRITARQLAIVSAGLLADKAALEARLEAAGHVDVTGGLDLTGAALWASLEGDIARQRTLLARILRVRVLPAPKGPPPNWRKGMPYFHPDYVEISRKI